MDIGPECYAQTKVQFMDLIHIFYAKDLKEIFMPPSQKVIGINTTVSNPQKQNLSQEDFQIWDY
jgi:hypothetical protein